VIKQRLSQGQEGAVDATASSEIKSVEGRTLKDLGEDLGGKQRKSREDAKVEGVHVDRWKRVESGRARWELLEEEESAFFL